MSGTVILLVVIVVTFLIGKYAIEEGQRVERQKKMMKDMENWDRKHKTKITINIPNIFLFKRFIAKS